MLEGNFPFWGSSDKDLYWKIQAGIFSLSEGKSSSVYDLLTKILEPNVEKRLTAE